MTTCAGITRKGDIKCQNFLISFIDSFGEYYCRHHAPFGSTPLYPKVEDQEYEYNMFDSEEPPKKRQRLAQVVHTTRVDKYGIPKEFEPMKDDNIVHQTYTLEEDVFVDLDKYPRFSFKQ